MDRTQKDNYQDQDKIDGNRHIIWVSIHYVGENYITSLLQQKVKRYSDKSVKFKTT